MGLFNSNYSNYDNQNDNSDESTKIYDDMKRNRRSTLLVFGIVIVIYLLYTMFGSQIFGNSTTTGRTPLESSKCPYLSEFFIGTSEYTWSEDDHTIVDSTIQEQAANFYTATGVQPVLYDLSADSKTYTEAELQQIADDFYENELFTKVYKGDGSGDTLEGAYDEGHFLIVFQAKSDSYTVAYHVGEDAKTVIDDAALGLFGSDLAENFSKKAGADVFSNTYKDAAKDIMGTSNSSVALIVIVIIALLIYAGITVFKRLKNQHKEGGTN